MEELSSCVNKDKDLNLLQRLNPQELQIIKMIRDNKFQSSKVIKKGGRIDMIEGFERIQDFSKIIDILQQHEYQNIEIKQSDGKIVLINRTVKTKV